MPNIYWDATTSTCSRCPVPFLDNTFGGYTGCYRFNAVPLSWPSCKTYCEGINGTFINLETKAEFDCVRNMMNKLQLGTRYFWVRKHLTST